MAAMAAAGMHGSAACAVYRTSLLERPGVRVVRLALGERRQKALDRLLGRDRRRARDEAVGLGHLGGRVVGVR